MKEQFLISGLFVLACLLLIANGQYKSTWEFIWHYYPLYELTEQQIGKPAPAFHIIPKVWVNRANNPNFFHYSIVLRWACWYWGIQIIEAIREQNNQKEEG